MYVIKKRCSRKWINAVLISISWQEKDFTAAKVCKIVMQNKFRLCNIFIVF